MDDSDSSEDRDYTRASRKGAAPAPTTIPQPESKELADLRDTLASWYRKHLDKVYKMAIEISSEPLLLDLEDF